MIRRLRDRHRWMIVAIAALTALALGWALLSAPSTAQSPSRRAAEASG